MTEPSSRDASSSLDAVFRALSHPVRRRIIRELTGGERTIGQLHEPLPLSLEAVSKHVRTLERAGLVRREVRGRRHLCHLEPAPLADADAWLRDYRRYWTKRLDALAAALDHDTPR